MIRVVLTDGATCVYGHAEYARKGEDIVCAGVSAIMQAAVLGLLAISEDYPLHVEVADQRTPKPTPEETAAT